MGLQGVGHDSETKLSPPGSSFSSKEQIQPYLIPVCLSLLVQNLEGISECLKIPQHCHPERKINKNAFHVEHQPTGL